MVKIKDFKKNKKVVKNNYQKDVYKTAKKEIAEAVEKGNNTVYLGKNYDYCNKAIDKIIKKFVKKGWYCRYTGSRLEWQESVSNWFLFWDRIFLWFDKDKAAHWNYRNRG